MDAESEKSESADESAGGPGGEPRNQRAASGMTAIRDARLDQIAIKRNWLGAKRWNTNATPSDFKKTEENRELTMKEQAEKRTFDLLNIPDVRAVGIGIKSVIAMESHNIKQEEMEREPTAKGGTQVNVQVNNQAGNEQVLIYIPDNGRHGNTPATCAREILGQSV